MLVAMAFAEYWRHKVKICSPELLTQHKPEMSLSLDCHYRRDFNPDCCNGLAESAVSVS